MSDKKKDHIFDEARQNKATQSSCGGISGLSGEKLLCKGSKNWRVGYKRKKHERHTRGWENAHIPQALSGNRHVIGNGQILKLPVNMGKGRSPMNS